MRESLGARVSRPMDLPEHGVTVAFVELPNTKVELLQPLGPDSPIAKFLRNNPDGGMHHVCFEVDDILSARDQLAQSGARRGAEAGRLTPFARGELEHHRSGGAKHPALHGLQRRGKGFFQPRAPHRHVLEQYPSSPRRDGDRNLAPIITAALAADEPVLLKVA